MAVVRSMTGQAGDRVQEEVADPPPDRDVRGIFLLEFAISQLTIVMTPQAHAIAAGWSSRKPIGSPELGKALHGPGARRSIRRLTRAFAAYAEAGKLNVPEPEAAAAFFNWLVMGAPVNDAMLLVRRSDARQAGNWRPCGRGRAHLPERLWRWAWSGWTVGAQLVCRSLGFQLAPGVVLRQHGAKIGDIRLCLFGREFPLRDGLGLLESALKTDHQGQVSGGTRLSAPGISEALRICCSAVLRSPSST